MILLAEHRERLLGCFAYPRGASPNSSGWIRGRGDAADGVCVDIVPKVIKYPSFAIYAGDPILFHMTKRTQVLKELRKIRKYLRERVVWK